MFLNDMSLIVRYSHVFMNRSLIDSNISATENYILMYLFKKERVIQEEIAEYFAVDKGSISKTINSLEKKGYIEKKVNLENRRENLICISDYGRNSFQANRHLLDKWHKTVMKGISKEEFDFLTDILSRMVSNSLKANDEDKRIRSELPDEKRY